ncbi:LysR family transcriptional regulator [uncultured Pelagimonas sp.]|uniref:LysR family transcriptional regulator n=1 Tax=uncultured Pelagimonas sp. TaxID=1618102 RepID=UPI00260EF392|nr:LysR family transcriptional regulator [uncultured Pelagimonas sp.]
MKITLRQCQYFRAVAKTGGIASAAEILGISQPAIAQAIRKLEDMTGLILFRRLHARGMELTPHGAEFLRHVETLLASAAQVEQAVTSIAENRSGTIRLGCFQSLAPFCLAQIVRGYKNRAPGVVLEVCEMLQHDLTDALVANELDLAILYDLGLDPGHLAWHTLAAAEPYLIVPPGHRLDRRHPASLTELKGEDFILFDAPQSREYFYAIFAKHGIRPQIAFRSASIESVRCSVAQGLGVSILSMRPASNDTYDGNRVVPIKLRDDLPPTPIVMAYRADPRPSALAEPLIEYCGEVFARMGHFS